MMNRTISRAALFALAIGTICLLSLSTPHPARAGEVIPHVGLSKGREGDQDAKMFGGVALRGNLARSLKAEIGVDYRNESRLGGDLNIRQWPVSASLWVFPLPSLYAGGGAGWYNTTVDYDESLGLDDRTTQDFGFHVGGGLVIPVGEKVGVDLNGRYVFMDSIDTELADLDRLDPDYWRMSLGLSLGF